MKTNASSLAIATLSSVLLVAATFPAAAATYHVYRTDGEAGLKTALMDAAASPVGTTFLEPSEVVVHAGEYTISNTIEIWPNTTLTLEDGVVIKAARGWNGPMLVGRHWQTDESDNGTYEIVGQTCYSGACEHGGYSQCHDVVVQGGVWDRNSGTLDNSAVMTFRHASGITVRNTTAKNSSNHFFNFSGSENVLVDNVIFSNSVGYLGSDPDFWLKYTPGDTTRYQTLEVIHLDFLDAVGEAGYYPLDGTPCRNILVSNCRFDSVFAGVGTHHYAPKDPATNVKIVGCTFRNLMSYAVYCFGFEDMEVTGNYVSGGRGLLDCKGASCIASDNIVEGANLYGVFATEGAYVNLHRNTFRRSAGIAICIRNGAATYATDNVFDTTGGHAAVLIACEQSILSGNTFRNVAKTAILATDGTPLETISNTIVSPGTQGITAQDGAKLTARSNVISNAKGNGILLQSAASGSSVCDNTATSSGSAGIRVLTTDGVTVSGNVVTGGKADGIVIDQCRSGTVSGNTVKQTAKHAMRLVGSKSRPTTVTVSNNVLATGKPKKTFFDLRLGDYCKKCQLVANTLVNKKYSVSKKGTSKNVFKPVPSTITKAKRSKSKKQVALAWSQYAYASGYEVQYSEKSSFKKAKTLISEKKTKATVKKLSAKKKYRFRVRTFQDLVGVRYYSDWSPVVIAK